MCEIHLPNPTLLSYLSSTLKIFKPVGKISLILFHERLQNFIPKLLTDAGNSLSTNTSFDFLRSFLNYINSLAPGILRSTFINSVKSTSSYLSSYSSTSSFYTSFFGSAFWIFSSIYDLIVNLVWSYGADYFAPSAIFSHS